MKRLFICTLLMVCAWPALATNLSIQALKDAASTWRFHSLLAVSKHASTQISGSIARRDLSGGNIDIAAHLPNGDLLAQTTSKPAVRTYRSKRKGGALFTARLKQPLPAGTTTKVAFHPDDLSCQHHPDTVR